MFLSVHSTCYPFPYSSHLLFERENAMQFAQCVQICTSRTRNFIYKIFVPNLTFANAQEELHRRMVKSQGLMWNGMGMPGISALLQLQLPSKYFSTD